MTRWTMVVYVLLAPSLLLAADAAQPLVSGMKNPESVCLGSDGTIYVTEIGEFGKDGDGKVTIVRDGKLVPFAEGLDDPKGIVAFQSALYVTDKTKVVKIDASGKVTTFAAASVFPMTPQFLNDIAIEPTKGTLFVSDSGDLMGSGGAVFSIDVKTGKTGLVIDEKKLPGLKTPNGLALDGTDHLLLVDFASGVLHRIKLADQSSEKVADGFDGGDGLTWDKKGRLFVTSWKTGQVFVIPKLGEKPILLSPKFEQAADSCLDAKSENVLIPDMKAGTLTAVPVSLP
ncbi:MAG: SMP-30/gluconolactonase/LRE family protein [Planctomycetaceae bacterium]